MKKRLLSALLALALVFVLLPTTALAGVTKESDYDISINGTGWKFEWDNTSGAYIPAYYYHTNEFSADENYKKLYTNDNLMLTKEGNTVTISFRRGTSNKIYSYPVKFTIESKVEDSGISCIEMGNGNNLVITGEGTKGTLTLTRDGKNGIGAALSSKVGDITITGGATVNVTFKKQSTPNVSGHAISVDNNDLIISGEGTTVEATNQSGASQDFSNDATVKVENGRIDVSGGAWLKATNEFSNTSKPYPSDFNNYSYFSCAISGDKDAPCTVSVTGENSCIIASAHNSTKYDVNTSMGQAYRWANFKVDGAKIEVGTSSPAQTITDINNIKDHKYAKISIPALPKTSDVRIAGENAVVGQWTNIPAATGTGSYLYNEANKELTLKDVNITSGTNAIQFMANGVYTIKLEGENKISNVSTGISAASANPNFTGNINVILSGSGSLDISAKGLAISMKKGDLKFENTGEIKLTTSNISETHNVLSVSGDISITDMDKYSVTGITKTGANVTGDTVTLSEANHLKGYTVGDTTTLFKTITITPAAAKPSTISYNGKTLNRGETIADGNGGTATVDSKNNTITLNNFKGDKLLEFNAEFTPNSITLIGDSTLSAVETKYQNLTISGSGSLTVGSIRVPNNTRTANLTITGGAHVTVGTATSDAKAIDITGNLTVNSGATLTATNTSETKPTIDVTGNVTISGDPGTNAYTVSAHNSYNVQKDRDGNLSPSEVPSAIKIGGTLNISAGARVMAQTDSYGAGVMLSQNSTITVEDAFLSAQNSSCDFAAISFSGQTGKIYVSGEKGKVVAENTHVGTNLMFRAINASVYNRNTDFYLKMQSEGVIDEAANKIIAPGKHEASGGKKVTITRGDAYTTPQVAANYTIAGKTMYVGKYYKTYVNGNITDGTAQDYNIYCDSANDFTLNNATISSTGTDAGINTNIRYETNVQYHIKLIGTNRINNTFKHAISAGSNSSTIIIEGVRNASDASLTINGNFLPIYSDGKVIINAEVVIVNTTDDNSFKGLISTSDGKGAFDLGSGYKCYASTSTTGNPLEEFNSANYSTYKYLRVTTQTLETGGGSTHQHTYDQSAWKSDATHHWQECTDLNCPDQTKGITNKASHSFSNGTCTVCGYRGQTEEHHFGTEWIYDAEYHWHECTDEGCDDISGKALHEWTGWRIDEPSLGMHNRFCNCGYNDDGHHYNLVYAAAGEAGHYQYCTVGNCTFKTSTEPHNYDGDTCTICNYTKSGEIVPPTPDNPGTIVIIRPAEEEKPAQQPNPSTGANDLVGLAVAAAVAAALGSAALLRKE